MNGPKTLREYIRLIVGRAVSDAIGCFGFGSRRQLGPAVIIAALALVGFLLISPLEQTTSRLGEALIYAASVTLTAFAYFLFFLFITPWRLHQALQVQTWARIEELERQTVELKARLDRSGAASAIHIDCAEIVIASVNGLTFRLVGEGLPDGTYLICRGVHLANRHPSNSAIVVVRLEVSGRTYDPTNMTIAHSGTPVMSMGFPSGLTTLLVEKDLGTMVNLSKESGDRGRIAYRVDKPIVELQQCEMWWVITDSMTETTVRRPVKRTREKWRVLK